MWYPHTKLGCLNFFILQFLFVRIAKTLNDKGKIIKWSIIGPVLPFTGWWTDYIGWYRFEIWAIKK